MITLYNGLTENLVYAFVPTINPNVTFEYFGNIGLNLFFLFLNL